MNNTTKDRRKRKNSAGQSMLEYMLLFAAVIAVLMVVLGPNGIMSQKLDATLDGSVDVIDKIADDFDRERYR
jgi:competence protein ComGC